MSGSDIAPATSNDADVELRIPLAVQAELRPPVNRWADPIARPIGVTTGTSALERGTVLREAEGSRVVHAGTTALVVHRKSTEGVALNLTGDGVLYVVMRPDDGPLGARVHLVTASDHEAQDHTDAGEDMVERVPMPLAVREAVEAFLALHHREEPFHKRKRKNDRPEEHKFGHEPIFARNRSSGGADR